MLENRNKNVIKKRFNYEIKRKRVYTSTKLNTMERNFAKVHFYVWRASAFHCEMRYVCAVHTHHTTSCRYATCADIFRKCTLVARNVFCMTNTRKLINFNETVGAVQRVEIGVASFSHYYRIILTNKFPYNIHAWACDSGTIDKPIDMSCNRTHTWPAAAPIMQRIVNSSNWDATQPTVKTFKLTQEAVGCGRETTLTQIVIFRLILAVI